MFNLRRFSRTVFQCRSFVIPTDYVEVTTDKNTGITKLMLDRYPVNSLNTEILKRIGAVLDDLEETKSKGIVLSSNIPGIFSAGLDLMELYQRDAEKLDKFYATFQNTWLKLYSASFPTVAVINGHSLGSSCMLAMSCDYRIMYGPKYTIGLNENKIGIHVPFWFMDVMKSIIGSKITERSALSGRMFKAEEALAVGLVDELVEKDSVFDSESEAESKVLAYLNEVNSCAADSRAKTKREYRSDIIEKFLRKKDAERKFVVELMLSPKMQKKLELYFEAMKKKE